MHRKSEEYAVTCLKFLVMVPETGFLPSFHMPVFSVYLQDLYNETGLLF